MSNKYPDTVGALDETEIRSRFAGSGVRVSIGPFNLAIHGGDDSFAQTFQHCYADFPLSDPNSFADASLFIEHKPRWLRAPRESVIRLNDGRVYTTLPFGDELPYVEWGTNLCIATRAHFFLMLHAGAVAKNGGAILLPGLPGSGKSTLTAFLTHRGWRLLSDEFGLITGPDVLVHPFPRLIPLKNESIGVIRDRVPDAKFGPSFDGTPKGTVAHVCPGKRHIDAMHETATPRLILFPTFQRGAVTSLERVTNPKSFIDLTKHAFNYILRGKTGFELVGKLVEGTESYRLVYSDLDDAERRISQLFDDLN